jgi:hypothetical protein
MTDKSKILDLIASGKLEPTAAVLAYLNSAQPAQPHPPQQLRQCREPLAVSAPAEEKTQDQLVQEQATSRFELLGPRRKRRTHTDVTPLVKVSDVTKAVPIPDTNRAEVYVLPGMHESTQADKFVQLTRAISLCLESGSDQHGRCYGETIHKLVAPGVSSHNAGFWLGKLVRLGYLTREFDNKRPIYGATPLWRAYVQSALYTNLLKRYP